VFNAAQATAYFYLCLRNSMPKKQHPSQFVMRFTPLPKERVAQWQAGMRAIYDLLMNASEGMILAAEKGARDNLGEAIACDEREI
jgi:Ni/Fe-hydrogenase subunit HybB-like protein